MADSSKKVLGLSWFKGIRTWVQMAVAFSLVRLRLDIRMLYTLPEVRPLAAIILSSAVAWSALFMSPWANLWVYGVYLCLPGWVFHDYGPTIFLDQWEPMIAINNIMARSWYNYGAIEMCVQMCAKILSLRVLREDPDEKFPTRYLITSNHMSNLDPWLVSYAFQCIDFGRPSYFVYAHSMDMIPVGGGTLPLGGHIPVCRHKTNTDRVTQLMDLSYQRLMSTDKASFTAFVEGTRSKSGELLPFKQGYPRFALQRQTPIVPVLIVNSIECWPAFSVVKMASAEVILVVGKTITPPKCAKPGEPNKEEVESFVKLLEKRTADLISVVPKKDVPSWWGGPHPDYVPKIKKKEQ